MVQLRVDVEAANARRAFEQASRAVDDLGDQLTQAEIDALRLESAMDDTAHEAARLRAEVARLGAGASDQLRNDLLAAERAALRARSAFAAADAEVDRLGRSLDDAEDEADRLRRAMDRLDRSAGRGFRGVQRAFLRAGQNSGDAFAAGLARSPLAAAVIALGPLLAPALGAAIDAALLAGIGGGVMAAGVALAIKQSDALQSAFSRTFRAMGDEAGVWAAGFEDELFGVADRAGRAWDNIADDLGMAFAKAQKFVEPFSEGLSQLVEKMIGGGGFNRAMDAAGPVIAQLSVGLSRMGDSFDSFFDSLADGGDGAVKGMIVIMALLNAAIVGAGNAIEFASRAFDAGTDFVERYAAAFERMLVWLPGVSQAWGYVADTLGLLNDEAGVTSDLMPIVGSATEATNGTFDRQATAARKAAEAAQELSNKLHGLISDQLTADQAALAWETTLDQLTESLQQNGATLDITNAKGQANVGIVLQMIQTAEQMRQAAIDLAGGERASAEAVAAANAKYFAQIEALRATLRAAGLTEAQIDALLGKYRQMANAPDITKRISVYHTTYYREVGGPNYNRTPGGQVAYASGTSSARAGIALVGEEGPELVRFKGGERVHSATESARMLAGTAATWTGGYGGMSSSGGAPAWSGSMGGLDALFFRWFNQSVRTGKLKPV